MCDFSLMNKVTLALSVLIILYMLKQIWNIIYVFVIGPIINSVDFKSYGEWAVVTGSTDGIGKAYARQLAARGCNIVLISRTINKLKVVSEEIEKEFNVKTKIVQADFTGDEDLYNNIADEIKDLEIGVLVNNVGMSYPYPEYFLDIPDLEHLANNLIKVNMVSVLHMTALILPDMVKRRKGIIINVSSNASDVPSPMISMYAGTKAFVTKFSIGLSEEYSKKGITVQCVTPGFVRTNMCDLESTSLMVPSSDTYVKSAIRLVNTKLLTSGYFYHALMFLGIHALQFIWEDVTIYISIKSFKYGRRIMRKKLNNQQ